MRGWCPDPHIGGSIACRIFLETIVWIVRTETTGHHRYWKVGDDDSNLAAEMARSAAGADTARAVTRIRAQAPHKLSVASGVVIEIVWESSPLGGASRQFDVESEPDRTGGKVLGEITFDTIVPEEGTGNIEGCYRVHGGNWYVYYFTNQHKDSGPCTGVPRITNNAVFSSGISGVSGVLPTEWTLNKTTVMNVLAGAVGVDGWTEVRGPNSLLLK